MPYKEIEILLRLQCCGNSSWIFKLLSCLISLTEAISETQVDEIQLFANSLSPACPVWMEPIANGFLSNHLILQVYSCLGDLFTAVIIWNIHKFNKQNTKTFNTFNLISKSNNMDQINR